MVDVSPVTHTSKMERLVGYGTALAERTPFEEGGCLVSSLRIGKKSSHD